MKKQNRMIALILALVMVLLSLAACTPGIGDKETTKAPATSGNEESKTEEPTTEEIPDWKVEHPGWLTEEKVTLKLMTNEGAGGNPPPSNDLRFWQFLEEYTNVHIEWEVYPATDYGTVVQTRLAAGEDLPDLMMTNATGNAVDGCMSGVLVDLLPYWETCFKDVDQYFTEQGVSYLGQMVDAYGHLSAIGGSVEPIEGHMVLLYNKDWLTKLNAKVPTTLDEFTGLLRKMKAAGDLNGNGETDEIMLTGSNLQYLMGIIGNAFGLEQLEGWDAFVLDKDGKVANEYTSENMKNCLTYLHMLRDEGLLDPSMPGPSVSPNEKVVANRVGVVVNYSANAVTYSNLTEAGKANPNSEQWVIGPALASQYNNNKGYFVQRQSFGSYPVAVTNACENVELACRWLNALLADPVVLNTRVNGFENETYKYDANGNIELIYKEDGSWSVNELGCGQLSLAFIQTKDQLLNTKKHIEWYMDQYDYIRENCEWKLPSVSRTKVRTETEQATEDLVMTQLKDYWAEMRDKFVLGDAEIATEWDTYVKTMYDLGMADWEGVWQSIHDRTK